MQQCPSPPRHQWLDWDGVRRPVLTAPFMRSTPTTAANDGGDPGARDDASVAVVAGVVYAGSNDGVLYALDADTGTEEWSYLLGESSSRSTTVADGVVYVGSIDGTLHAVDAESGSAVWTLPFGSGTIGTPVVAGGVVYEAVFGGQQPRLYAIDAATGEVDWEFATDTGANAWVPAAAGDTLYAVSDDTNIYAIDAATGDVRWHARRHRRTARGRCHAGR